MKKELVKFKKEHLKNTRQWMNNKQICRLFCRVYKPITVKSQQKWYESYKKDKTQLLFAIEIDGAHIGNVGFRNISYLDRKAEFFIVIGNKDYWSKGIGTWATNKILAHMTSAKRGSRKLHKIYLQVDQTNERAIRSYKKVGFVKEGILKDELVREGKYVTMVRMAYIKK